jgi:hypothetical protein
MNPASCRLHCYVKLDLYFPFSIRYCVSTVGLDEEKIRRYVKYQEENERLEEKNADQWSLF